MCRLSFISVDWVKLFPDYIQLTLPRPISDHSPISFVIGLEDWGPHLVRLELVCLKEKSFLVSVFEWWQEMSIEE